MDRAILDEFAEFTIDFGCDATPTIEAVSDSVTKYSWIGCSNDIETALYEIAGAGHTWPGSATSAAISVAVGLGATTLDVNASELSWEFFSEQSLE